MCYSRYARACARENFGQQARFSAGGWIFNTEAHPIDPGALYCCSAKRQSDEAFMQEFKDSIDFVSLLDLHDPFLHSADVALDEKDLHKEAAELNSADENAEEADRELAEYAAAENASVDLPPSPPEEVALDLTPPEATDDKNIQQLEAPPLNAHRPSQSLIAKVEAKPLEKPRRRRSKKRKLRAEDSLAEPAARSERVARSDVKQKVCFRRLYVKFASSTFVDQRNARRLVEIKRRRCEKWQQKAAAVDVGAWQRVFEFNQSNAQTSTNGDLKESNRIQRAQMAT